MGAVASLWLLVLLLAFSTTVCTAEIEAAKPSIVFFLTDDQDYIIGGFDKMEKTKRLIGDRGATFSNALVHSPICAISRSELQSGRYLYNIKSNNLPTPVKKGMASAGNGGQHHVNYTGLVAQNNFGKFLHDQAGYTCGMFGKWMNEYNTEVAPGWDRWFAGMGYGNLSYVDSESPTGTYIACPYELGSCENAPHMGYTTSLIGNKSLEWIRKVAPQSVRVPFFAYVAVTAPHLPDVPPPWYGCGNASCPSVWPTVHPHKHAPAWYADCAGVQSPRLPNFNMDGTGFHEQIASQLPFDDEAIRYVDKVAVMRCLTLLAVDDTVAELSGALDELQVASHTYFIYSSDHGYNLGHHRLPDNKFNSYLHDLRVPLLIRGPGIQPGLRPTEIVTQVDYAPTFLGLAGIVPPMMDGRSLVQKILIPNVDDIRAPTIPASVVSHWETEAVRRPDPWRTYGLCAWYMCGFSMLNHSEDDASNTFLALYVNDSAHGLWKYAEFDPTGKQTNFGSPNFYELFDLTIDPHETVNVYYNSSYPRVTPELKDFLHKTAHTTYTCQGAACP